MTFSTSVQIFENYEGQKVFVLSVQTELINLVFRQYLPEFSLTLSPL
jgi:hypothetical protein